MEDLLTEVCGTVARAKLVLTVGQDEEINSRFYDHYLSVSH